MGKGRQVLLLEVKQSKYCQETGIELSIVNEALSSAQETSSTQETSITFPKKPKAAKMQFCECEKTVNLCAK